MKKLYIEPTSRCNFACVMCFRNSWFDETKSDMTEETFSALSASLPALHTLETVFFGGMGEPLLHPDILRMVSAVSPFARTELLTNGALLTRDMAEGLKEAGLARLWLSVDSFSPLDDRIRPGSRFSRLIENLSAFATMKNRPALGITFVMMRENLGELSHINAFADRFGADLINLSHAVPCTPLPEREAIYDMDIPVGKMARLGAPVLPKGYDRCPFIEADAAFVRSDGGVAPCMQLLHNADTYLYEEKRHVKRCIFGNVREEPLQHIWEKPDYAAFRKRVREFAFPCCTVCMGCEDRRTNDTDCMYNTFPTCGACLWSQGKIFCP